jgi:hypothetical protein
MPIYMKKLRHFIIGEYLLNTSNVFERAKVQLLYNFTVFYLLNLILFSINLYTNHYYYHAAIITFAMSLLVAILVAFRQQRRYKFIALILMFQQIITGLVSYLIQQSSMDFVGEFWIVVNILITFFTLGKKYGFIMAGIWFLQLVHCLVNDASGGKFILIHIPSEEILPPAPYFILIPFSLCIYIIYEFVKTRSVAEQDIQEQKRIIEHKNQEILDSMRYASRIQRSHLPTEKYIRKVLRGEKS